MHGHRAQRTLLHFTVQSAQLTTHWRQPLWLPFSRAFLWNIADSSTTQLLQLFLTLQKISMSTMPNRLWKPTHGLLPILGDHSYPAQLDFEMLRDVLPTSSQNTEDADHLAVSRGSPEHLSGLLKDLEYLRDAYLISQTPNTSEVKEAFEDIIAECLELLDPPDTIEDVTCRTQFFQIVRETAVQIMGLIEKRNNLKATIDILPNTYHRLLEKSNGYLDGLPRWSQFLCFNAPGAAKLQLHNQRNVLLNRRRGYQVLPQGGIGILRHWDAELYRFIRNVDEHNQFGMWGARFEWGSLGQHRLALGIRRFDPLIVRPSPWAKEPRFIDTERNTRMEVEALDRWLGKKLNIYVPPLASTTHECLSKNSNNYVPPLASTTQECLSKNSNKYVPSFASTTQEC